MLHFLHKLEQLDGITVQFVRASPGSDLILEDLKSPGAATVLPITVTFTYKNFVLVKGLQRIWKMSYSSRM